MDNVKFQQAQVLKDELAKFGQEYDLYTCCAAVIYNKIPMDVTETERKLAKLSCYQWGVGTTNRITE